MPSTQLLFTNAQPPPRAYLRQNNINAEQPRFTYQSVSAQS